MKTIFSTLNTLNNTIREWEWRWKNIKIGYTKLSRPTKPIFEKGFLVEHMEIFEGCEKQWSLRTHVSNHNGRSGEISHGDGHKKRMKTWWFHNRFLLLLLVDNQALCMESSWKIKMHYRNYLFHQLNLSHPHT